MANEDSIIKQGRSLGARKISILEKYKDGAIKVVFICDAFNICYKVKGNLFDQLYIDYC